VSDCTRVLLGWVEVITLIVLLSPPWPLWHICVINDHEYVPLVVNTSRSFPHSWPITGFVTRLTWWVPPVEQELLTLLEHLSSPPLFGEVRVSRSLVLRVCFVDRCLTFCTFFWAIVLSFLLRYTDFDYPFGIFKLFLYRMSKNSGVGLYRFHCSMIITFKHTVPTRRPYFMNTSLHIFESRSYLKHCYIKLYMGMMNIWNRK
jgi:hypothetical protein